MFCQPKPGAEEAPNIVDGDDGNAVKALLTEGTSE